jgi:arylsulfatase A-like enzyme
MELVMRVLQTWFIIIFTIPFCSFGASGFLADTTDDPPNVLYINVDDLGWKDLGFMGSSYYETPHLDNLASEGMVFMQAYASAANCAPSRACLMSGQNTPRHGIYTVSNSDRGNPKTRKIIPAPNNEVLADSIYTLAEMFRDNGYSTGTFGKWHLGQDPKTQGFEINAGGSHHGNPGKGGYFSPYNVNFLEDGPDGEYLTDRLTSEAIKFMKDHQEKPFFLYLPYYSVHTPIMGKEAWVRKFEHKPGVLGQDSPDYAAMIASVDENVGRLLRELETLGLQENTLVIFTSDNGGIRDISHQDPLRAGKGSYYEGGIRVPLVIRWPGKISPGSHNDTPVTNLDFYPTLKKVVGSSKGPAILDGHDLSPLFAGNQLPDRSLFWHFPIYLQDYNPREDEGQDPLFRTRPGSVIRQGKWKLHEYFEDGTLELYNMEEDLGERNNLVKRHPQKVRELYQILQSWQKETKATIPRDPNPEYDPVFESKLVNKFSK